MSKIFHLSLLLVVLFLSTFFVGCKPQGEPIALEDITLSPRKKVVEKTLSVEKPVEIEQQQQIPGIQSEGKNKNKRLVVVNVTVDGGPAIGATVNLSSSPVDRNGNLFIEKKTDENGIAEIYIPKHISGFCAKAYNDNYISGIISCGHLSPDLLSSKNIKLKLSGKGIIVTAIVENRPRIIKNLHAEIVRANSHKIDIGTDIVFAATTNITGNKITFTPISVGSANMCVRLTGDNIPQCYSEKFKTKNKREVIVRIPASVTLKGKALLPDGSPVTNEFSVTVSSAKKLKGVYKVKANVQPENDGSYAIPQLSEGQFKLFFLLNGYKSFSTNIFLTAPETKLNFSFGDYPAKELCGIVVTESDNEPVEGVTVKARMWHGSSKPYASCVTDRQGNFSIEVKEFGNCYFGEIIVEEPGFAKVIRQISVADNFIKIILRQAGNITGEVMNKDGKLLSGITISIDSIQNKKNIKQVFNSNETVYYKSVSDSDGHFEFLNVVAPAKYGFRIDDFNSGWSIPSYNSGKGFTVEVEPDETAERDLIAEKTAVIAVKAKEANGTPVLKYKYTCNLKLSDFITVLNHHVDVSEDEWYHVKTIHSGDGTFSCNASEEQKGLSLVTNSIPIYGQITNYITLIFSSSEPELSGHIFNPDSSPAANSTIQIIVNRDYIKATADAKGYFEVHGVERKEGTMMNVTAHTWKDRFELSTNLISGTKNVKLKFQQSYEITGKVFLDDLDSPAKSFVINQSYTQHSYNSADGTFVFKLGRSQCKKKDTMVISADGYLPEVVKFDFTKELTCNVGNIILKSGKTAKIHGRAVDQNDKPLELLVTLNCSKFQKTFSVITDEKDGNYAFEDVPPGKAAVSARSRLGFSASHKFEVEEGDDMELPDLVLNYTNSAVVKLTFKLPDGTSPINTRIINQNFYIKKDGTATGELKAGKYSGWKIKYDDKMYAADEFEITENTDELEIWMRED